MGRNAYINFYIWFYNEHRGQAPVTIIAKRAGITWRKMTPQEKGRFQDKNHYTKGKMPMFIVPNNKAKKVQNVQKAQRDNTGASRRDVRQRKRLKSIPKRKVSKWTYILKDK